MDAQESRWRDLLVDGRKGSIFRASKVLVAGVGGGSEGAADLVLCSRFVLQAELDTSHRPWSQDPVGKQGLEGSSKENQRHGRKI